MSAADSEARALFCTKTDPKAWAKRIMYRLEKDDKSLLPIQIQFARAALGIVVQVEE